jgi:hypothetical protein
MAQSIPGSRSLRHYPALKIPFPIAFMQIIYAYLCVSFRLYRTHNDGLSFSKHEFRNFIGKNALAWHGERGNFP